ncbi:hypothetical protein CAC42_2192 [Sphaceloma murrayae]|uniref:General negative regulator of transcription subunit 4 n=1 Tax=Sphaceloma murrayae TaxID=2082308 RepID=A0A2K1QJD4_9PEZI|nr:hypothetical protein CAC42_2192 [Sphaceloma murrayae]
MSRTQQDQFIDDDEEETCPLCVEEFDLSDRGFRPCPCGYQICQFCYHNVRNNMNGLCPACRRPYDESVIEFRKPSAEEEAAWRAKQASKQKKTAVAQQKEVLKREADTANRKHLAGLRVVQKNLVYVTGLSPSVQEDRLLETLRGPQYFGQYGKIIKIVVSKAKDNQSSVGVYVTYARKEDAASCINAVDGSQNGERTLRAQFGTTKYCSAYLRNEQCQNRNCMFLHEPGEDKDSFTRQDLSSMNVASTQQQSGTTTQPSQPPPQSQQPVAAARPESTAPSATSVEPGPGPALPSSASWASKPYPPSRSVSRAATATSSSPALTNVVPSQPAPEPQAQAPTVQPPQDADEPVTQPRNPPRSQPQAPSHPFVDYINSIMREDPIAFSFGDSNLTDEQRSIVQNMSCLIDPSGGKKRRLLKNKLEEQQRQTEERVVQEDTEDELQRSGSLQLGGEPEDPVHSPQHTVPPSQAGPGGLDPTLALDSDLSQLNINNRGMTPAQQQLLLQRFKSSPSQNQSYSNQQAGTFPAQANPSAAPGHARNASRFSFANESSAGTSVKPVANSKLMQQQSAMMPSGNAFGQQSFYTSTVSGPPPGLKTTGTPPVSGGGMFGQGHGFATGGLGYGSNMASRNSNDEMMRELFRRRELGGQDAGKREYMSSSLSHTSSSSTSAAAPGLLNFPFHAQNVFQDANSQKPKKKGKKHRHANTSSSGGGVVDVADPSILQARLQQGNSLGGQGSYAGQGFETISQADENDPFRISTPGSISSQQQSGLRNITGRATPPVPPGLEGLGHVPQGQAPGQSTQGAGLRLDIKPAVPANLAKHVVAQAKTNDSRKSSVASVLSRPVSPAVKPSATGPQTSTTAIGPPANTAEAKPSAPTRATAPVQLPIATPTKIMPAVLTKSQDSPAIKDRAAATDTTKPLVQTPGTTQNTPLATPVKSSTPYAAGNKGKSTALAQAANSVPSTIDSSKRKHPGKLDITAAVNEQAEAAKQPMVETPVKSRGPGTPSIPSRPGSPGATADAALKRRAHTIRLVSTPQVEKAPVLQTPLAAAVAKIPSRNPSIASANPPGTPSSEHISDTISLTSTSVSRPASPPLGSRVGAAPVRTKTKNQLKKERQERAKAAEEDKKLALEPETVPDDDVIHEAITSRKKKAKKPAATPKPKPKQEQPQPASPAEKQPTTAAPSPPAAPPTAAPQPENSPAPPTQQEDSPAALVNEMRSAADFLSKAFDVFFRPLAQTNAHYKPTQPITPADLDLSRPFDRNPPAPLYADELKRILKTGELFRYGGNDNRIWSQGCVTPGGVHLRYLESELEERFGQLERDLGSLPRDAIFRPDRTRTYTGVNVTEQLPSVDLEGMKRDLDGGAVRTREANAMEKAVEEGSKKGSFLVGNAEIYLNEFVLPVVSQGRGGEGKNRDDGQKRKGGLEELERQLSAARKVAEEKEAALRKVIKRNRKLVGLH